MDINHLVIIVFSNYFCYRIGMYVGAMRLLTKLENEARQQMERILEEIKLEEEKNEESKNE